MKKSKELKVRIIMEGEVYTRSSYLKMPVVNDIILVAFKEDKPIYGKVNRIAYEYDKIYRIADIMVTRHYPLR